MTRTATDTRERILDAAQGLILAQGYGATSIDDILSHTDLTKGAFFHHFRSKKDLATALIERYAAHDAELFRAFLARADRLGRTPLQQVQVLLGLYEEEMAGLSGAHPGCLFASYAYQAGLFDEVTKRVVRKAFLLWREEVAARLRRAMETRKPALPVSAEDLADGAMATMEGAFVLSMTLRDPSVIARQIRQFRNYLDLLFGAG
jgi:TetR/AcrR family transcriptional repressor of nem operon